MTNGRSVITEKGIQPSLPAYVDELSRIGGFGVFEYDYTTGQLHCSDQLYRLFGIERSERALDFQEWRAFIHGDDVSDVDEALLAALTHRTPYHAEYRIVRGDGSIAFIGARAEITCDADGRPLRIVGLNWDITDRKRAEIELEASNNRNLEFIRAAPTALAMLDTDLRYLAASDRWYHDYGLVDQDIIGRSHYEIFPEISEEWKAIHRDVLLGNAHHKDEDVFVRADGTEQWLSWECRPWFRSPDIIGGMIMHTVDITNAKRREVSLRRMENILQQSSSVARIGAWEVYPEEQRVNWSDVTRAIHGVAHDYQPTLDEAIGFYKEGVHRNAIQEAAEQCILHNRSFDVESKIITAAGMELWVRAIGQPDPELGGRHRIFGVFQDINARRKAEEELRAANAELRSIFNAATQVSVIVTDVQGTILQFSRGAERLLGYRAEDVIGTQSALLVHDASEIMARSRELTDLFGRPVEGFDVLTERVKAGSFESREWTYIRKGGSRFPVQLVVTGVRTPLGDVTGFLAIATDISERREYERRLERAYTSLQRTSDQLKKQNEQLLDFAHITSHNLRAPVANLLALIKLLQDNPSDAERAQLMEHFGIVVDHLNDTLGDLAGALQVQFDEELILEPVLLSDVVSKVLHLLAASIQQVQGTVEVDVPEVNVFGNRALLESIVQNLLSNSIKYRDAARLLHIRIAAYEAKGRFVLTVTDNGLGIDLGRYWSKIFGFHKTFHRSEDARGVGLYLARMQAERMGGLMFVASDPGIGSTFALNMPLLSTS